MDNILQKSGKARHTKFISRTLHSNKWKPVLVCKDLQQYFFSDSLLWPLLDRFRLISCQLVTFLITIMRRVCHVIMPTNSCFYFCEFCSVSSLFCWYKSSTVWWAGTSWMSSQPWWKSSKSLHSNKWKPFLVCKGLQHFFSFWSDSLLRHLLDCFRL